jgi:hypothetical protein
MEREEGRRERERREEMERERESSDSTAVVNGTLVATYNTATSAAAYIQFTAGTLYRKREGKEMERERGEGRKSEGEGEEREGEGED